MADYVVDAKNESLGRLASRIAFILQGKNSANYEARNRGDNRVIVKNANMVKLTGKKAEQKVYYRHSGRPGGLKKLTYEDAFARSPEWVIRHAVRGMLPKNKLLKERLKMLKFERSETKDKENG